MSSSVICEQQGGAQELPSPRGSGFQHLTRWGLRVNLDMAILGHLGKDPILELTFDAAASPEEMW